MLENGGVPFLLTWKMKSKGNELIQKKIKGMTSNTDKKKIKLKYSILESNYPKPQKNWTNTLQKILINKRFIVLLISCWLRSFKFHWQKPKIDQEIKRRLQCFNEKCGCISQWCHLLKNPSKEGFLSIVFNSYSITYIYA